MCKIFEVKSHESFLEQSKKDVIRDRFVRSDSRVNSMRAAHRVNASTFIIARERDNEKLK